MSRIKAHFDGRSVVLDEPASLAVGQAVVVVVNEMDTLADSAQSQESDEKQAGSCSPLADSTAVIPDSDGWDESIALQVDPQYQIPSQFVRRPGSAAGRVIMADDFNDTPEGFEEDA